MDFIKKLKIKNHLGDRKQGLKIFNIWMTK